MRKTTTTLILAIFAFALSAQQSISYAIDTARIDSFYLVEIVSTVRQGSPKPDVANNYTFFTSPAQLNNFTEKLRQESERMKIEAEKQYQAAQLLSDRARVIEELKNAHRWWAIKPRT